MGEIKSAVETLEKALVIRNAAASDTDPVLAEIWYRLGLAHRKMRELATAEQNLTKALQIRAQGSCRGRSSDRHDTERPGRRSE